ncbi:hypothetical protein [Rhodococcus koreensis]
MALEEWARDDRRDGDVASAGISKFKITAGYRILETRRLADDVVLGYLNVDFSFTDRPTLTVYPSMLVRQSPVGDLISHYQVSRLN